MVFQPAKWLSRTAKTAQAALIAQSRLAELGIVEPLEEGEYSGISEDSQVPYRWRCGAAFDWGYAAELRERGLEMYKVEVDVFCQRRWEQQYQLATLRTARGGEP